MEKEPEGWIVKSGTRIDNFICEKIEVIEKEHVMSDEMKLFFGKLLELKEFVRYEARACQDASYCDTYCSEILENVYEKLDAIIKEKK